MSRYHGRAKCTECGTPGAIYGFSGGLLCASCDERFVIRQRLEEHRLRYHMDRELTPEERAYLDGAIEASEPRRPSIRWVRDNVSGTVVTPRGRR
jgi:uncharacterized Zn finger protein (UPF0148 family)